MSAVTLEKNSLSEAFLGGQIIGANLNLDWGMLAN
jgi:hypothetical protein